MIAGLVLEGEVQKPSIEQNGNFVNSLDSAAIVRTPLAIGPRGELNDLCTHERPSYTAIAIRPANESDIRYAVMRVSFEHEARHRRA